MTTHDLDAAVECFATQYRDEAPARRGETFQGNQKVRENFAGLFRNIPDVRADLLRAVADGDTVWMEWRMHGARLNGTQMEFVGVNIFGVRDDQFIWGRIYTELVRDAGGLEQARTALYEQLRPALAAIPTAEARQCATQQLP